MYILDHWLGLGGALFLVRGGPIFTYITTDVCQVSINGAARYCCFNIYNALWNPLQILRDS